MSLVYVSLVPCVQVVATNWLCWKYFSRNFRTFSRKYQRKRAANICNMKFSKIVLNRTLSINFSDVEGFQIANILEK